jgi:Zn-dependent M28 family amino/carboxypeptidase
LVLGAIALFVGACSSGGSGDTTLPSSSVTETSAAATTTTTTTAAPYLEAYNNGASVLEGLQALPVGDDVNDVWIRIEHSPSGDATVVYVATKEGEWERLGPVIRGIPTGALAIGAASIPGPGSNPDEDLVARFDWVEVEVYD